MVELFNICLKEKNEQKKPIGNISYNSLQETSVCKALIMYWHAGKDKQ